MICTSCCICRFMYSWWWVQRAPETCAVILHWNKTETANCCISLDTHKIDSRCTEPWTEKNSKSVFSKNSTTLTTGEKINNRRESLKTIPQYGLDAPQKMRTCILITVNIMCKSTVLPFCWEVTWMEFEPMHFLLNIMIILRRLWHNILFGN
jgi:hypothetical protein